MGEVKIEMGKVTFFAIALVVLISFTKSEEQQSLLPVDPILSHRALLGVENGAEVDRKKRDTGENEQVSSKTQVKAKRLSSKGFTGMDEEKKNRNEPKRKKELKKAIKKKGR